ncbi:MAG: M61 family peptidase [Acidobacteriota bacterium]|nr:M61 family peptidase [Acidobacteriota bacterium]
MTVQASFAFAQSSVNLKVDATDAAKNMLHTRETLAVKSGALTLFYPKWIPGEHAPTGPLNNMINLFITANGKPIAWRRDEVEMFAFHLTIPDGVSQIEISFDDAAESGSTASAQLARIKWNRLLVYPQGAKSDDVRVSASLKMPADWKYATALTTAKETGNTIDFKEVSLTTFVDSPAVIGKYFKRVPLVTVNGAAHEIDLFADTAEALEYKPETLNGWNNLIKQANAAFGAKHYNNYKFLVTLSDNGGSEGLEHHESSEDGTGEKALSDEYELLDLSGLLGHEYTHSWNGKFRRPNGLATGDYDTPQKGELLWVYEGLTEYLGDVFPTRSGLWTPEMFRDVIAEVGANMDTQTGRRWRPLVDTATAVQFTYAGSRSWRNQRRGADYYYEGELVWLEADVLIRQKSNGKMSLDDFLKKFHGGQNSAPLLKPYDLNEVVKTLNEIVPYDWRTFFNDRIYQVQKNAPLGGITNGGWKLIYNDTPNTQVKVNEARGKYANLSYSIGILVNEEGVISDLNPDLAAAKSGLAPAMKITKINGADFSIESLHKAIAATKNVATAIAITATNGNATETYKLNYSGGEKYPHLERDTAKADLLSGVATPLFIFQMGGSRRGNRTGGVINQFANVTNLLLNQSEIIATCSTNPKVCSENHSIEVSTTAVDPENDVLTYNYTVSAGEIIGTGANVVWDLSGVAPGTYTITAGVDDSCGICGKTQTQTVKVVACPDCKQN